MSVKVERCSKIAQNRCTNYIISS